MCIELGAFTIFILLATWSAIIYFSYHPGVLMLTILFIGDTILLCIHLLSDCHVNYVKAGAATEAALLILLIKNVGDSGRCTRRNSRTNATKGPTSTTDRCMEEARGSKKVKSSRED